MNQRIKESLVVLSILLGFVLLASLTVSLRTHLQAERAATATVSAEQTPSVSAEISSLERD